jgi:hypothetical protein
VMDREDIRIGQRVQDRSSHRTGTVLGIYRPANNNLDPTEALIETDRNAVSWIRFENMEEIS